MKSSYNFYKLFGYDIMLDSQCFPKLIEINSRPAALDDKLDSFVNRWRHLINISFTDSTLSDKHEGFIEELSTCFYLDTTLLKSTESVLSETKIFSMKMIDTHFKS